MDETAPNPAGVEGRRDVVAAVADAPVGAQGELDAIDLAADQPVRATGYGGNHEAVGAAGDRVGTEQHTAPRRLEERLHEHRDRCLASRPGDLVDRVDESLPPPHVEDRREHPGHRLGATVLHGGRRPDDDRVPAVDGERLPGGIEGDGVVPGRRAIAEGAGPGGGEHESGQRGLSVGAGAGERCCLGASNRGILRQHVVEIDDRREILGLEGGGAEPKVRHV